MAITVGIHACVFSMQKWTQNQLLLVGKNETKHAFWFLGLQFDYLLFVTV